MKRLDEDGVVDELVGRLARLTPDTRGRWGRMTAPEMVCHLLDSYHVAMGKRDVSSVDTLFTRTLLRFFAIHVPVRWPQGVPTRPEIDPQRQGTRPEQFEREREMLATLIRAFAGRAGTFAPHPAFGPMTRREWMIWGYRHPDHHFRQFGI